MRERFWKRELLWGGILVVLVSVVGCGGKNEPAPATESQEDVSPAVKAEPAQSTPDVALGDRERVPAPPVRGVVLAGKELGMTVGGQGAGVSGRSLDVLERQVLTLLPEIRDAYERERQQEPTLMGSVDVSMVIEPNGGVSDLRFPVRRVSNDRLLSAVFDQMRAWVFPPADLPVQLRLTLLFVPPGIDEASIFSWEKRLGSRPVIEKVDETPPTVVASATQEREIAKESQQEKQEQESLKTEAKPAVVKKRRVAVSEVQPERQKNTAPSDITGWYRVLYPTALRSAPRSSAQVIAQLKRNTRVRVVSVIGGQWLEVRSVSDRPPGYLWWEDAAPESPKQVGRR